jgi:hypothetical protein
MFEVNKNSNNILLIQYPSGGYGYYLARLINQYVSNVVKTDDSFKFDSLGTSHSLPLVAGDVHFSLNRVLSLVNKKYQLDIDQKKYVVIPYCPGIEDDSTDKMRLMFPNAKIVRLFYEDSTWPLVFQNCIIKALRGSLEKDVTFDSQMFGSSDAWAQRENFSLIYNSHYYRNTWKKFDHYQILNIDIFDLLITPDKCINTVAAFIDSTAPNLSDLPYRHQDFLQANKNTVVHLEILNLFNNIKIYQELEHITQLYQQAAVNFYIQTKFGFEVPSNEYASWFTNTKDIVTMLNKYSVTYDSN